MRKFVNFTNHPSQTDYKTESQPTRARQVEHDH